MKTRTRILPFLAVLLIALSACSAPAASPTQPVDRQVSVTGTGKVTLIPDIATVSIGVHSEAPEVAEALSANSIQAQQVTDALLASGVLLEDIQTTAFNVYPQQNYGPQGEMLDLRYAVDNTVSVTVRDLANLGEVLNTVVQSGANSINGITFDVSDRSAAESNARKAAVADARAQAEALAAAAGGTLGKVISIQVTSYTTPTTSYSLKGDGAVSSGSSVPVSAGQIQIAVDVNMSFTLE